MSMHPSINLFKKFKDLNRVFVETGSYRGDGIQLALEAGFDKIISIDTDPRAIDFCRNRFDLYNNPQPKIELIPGDSALCLLEVIKAIKEPMTFWLDSHWQMLEGTDPGDNPFPLMEELHQICKHRFNEHTIIIDDMLIMQKNIVGYDKDDIEAKLLRINQFYTLEYFANPVINNILVAHL
jgi:hypothetical protein